MSKIYIASKEVTGHEIGGAINREHLYLVYDPNDIIDGDELVIRGGPFEPMEWTGPLEADHGNIFIDAARPLVDSDDAFQAASTPETPGTRNFTELGLLPGQTTDQVWSQLVAYAKSMGTYNPTTQRVEATLDYGIFGPNSNGTIGSILSGGAGINIHDTLPRQFGPGGAIIPANVFTGLEHYYVSGGGTKTIVISDSHTKTFYDSGTGDTTVVLDANKIGAGGITLFSDSLAGTLDRVVLKGVDPSNILLWTYNGNDLWIEDRQGHVLAKLMGQLDSANKFNGLDVEKPDGTLAHFALPQTEQDIALWTPSIPLPGWVGQVTEPYGNAETASSPLVIDVDGDGIELSAKDGPGAVYWDLLTKMGKHYNKSECVL